MRIYIPSHKRSHLMTTWKNLPEPLREITEVVIYGDEWEDYVGFPRLRVPDNVQGIADKRNFILTHAQDFGNDKFMILDDDLTFAKRREDEPTKFRPCQPWEIIEMVQSADNVLDHYAHGAIATREGGNRDINEYKFNTRALRAHFFRADILDLEGVSLNGTKFMSDFDTTLTLLEKGCDNIILNNWVTNQAGSNTEGGCSETRTLDDLAEAAHELKRRHPAFVTVVQKVTKGAWGGGERTDVRIQWKKARESANE